MTFRAIALGNDGQTSTSTTITFTVPPSTASGDVMTVAILTNSGTATYSVAGGGGVTWTARSPGPRDQGDGNAINTEVWTATANGTSASTTVTVTSSNSARDCGVLLVESGVLESGVLLAVNTSTGTASTTWAFPSVTIPDNTGWSLIGIAAIRSSSTTPATLTAPGSFVTEGQANTAYVTTPQLSVAAIDVSSTVTSGSQSPGTGTLSTSQLATTYTLGFAPAASNFTPKNTGSHIQADTASLVQGLVRAKTDPVRAGDTASSQMNVVRANTGSVTAGDSATAVKGTARAFTGYDSVRDGDRGSATGPQVLTDASRSRAVSAADGAVVQVHHTPVGLNLTTFHIHADGTLHRWLRDQIVVQSTVPGAPNNVKVSLTGTTATLTWATPSTDGGADISGYIVKKTGGSTHNLGAAVFSDTFTGITPPAQFSVAAVNANGTGPAVFISLTITRFPGDTNPLKTGLYMLGIDEKDKDPAVKSGTELSAPELLTGRPPSAMRYFYGTGGNFSQWGNPAVTSSTAVIKDIKQAHSRGWIPWISMISGAFGSFADMAANGYTLFLNLVTYIEDNMTAPVWITLMHEPENQTTDFPGPANSTETDYGDMNREFRRAMDTYAAAHGGVGVYIWKYVAFAPIFQADTFLRTGLTTTHGIDNYWYHSVDRTASVVASTDTFTLTNHRLANGRQVTLPIGTPAGLSASATYFVISATSNTFKVSTTLGGSAADVTADASAVTVRSHDLWDFIGVDPYVHPGESSPTGPFKGALNWCKTAPHAYALSAGENGINLANTDAGVLFNNEWTYITNGNWDFVCLNYWNIGGDSLTDSNTQGLLTNYVTAAKGANVVNYWQVPRPDGGTYPKPAGV